MKIRYSIIALALIFSVFHFSPQAVEATEDETVVESEKEVTEGEPEQSNNSNEVNEDEDQESEENAEVTDKPSENEKKEEHTNETEEQDSDKQENQSTEKESINEESKDEYNEIEEESVDSEEDTQRNQSTITDISQYEDGDSGQHIVELKEKLVDLGFANWSPPTEHYGPITAGVVEDFQAHYDLSVTGIANSKTRAKIDEILTPPYQDGDRGAPVVELKNKLVELGFAGWSSPSQFYGSITAGKVEDFQRHYGLTVDGIAGEETLNQIEEALEEGVRYNDGDSGQHIVELKEKLVDLGFANWSPPTKHYGPITAGVVEDFQAHYNLSVTGIADYETRAKIDEVLNPPYQDGDRGVPIVELKEKLVELGFAGWSSPSQFYGNITAGKVEDFQRHYELTPDGVADEETLNQIEEALEQGVRYSDGDSGQHIVELKEKLVDLGFANWSPPTEHYGPITAGVVEDFQAHYNLSVTGVADSEARAKIDEVLNPPYQDGDRGVPVVELKEKLVELGFAGWSSPSQFYGSITAGKVEDFQRHYGLTVDGIAGEETLNQIEEALEEGVRYSDGDSGQHIVELKEKLVDLGFATWSPPTKYYGPITTGVVEDFQKAYGLPVTGIADSKTLSTLTNAHEDIVKIFIDPGHGGTDPGGQGYGLDEKDVVLDIALEAANVLEEEYIGVQVKLSRTTDTLIELEDRGPMANNWGADYFVSIHNNAFNGSASGFESYIYNGGVSDVTKQRQRDMHEYLINQIDTNDRGMKRANFNVLRTSTMPAILLEYLFIDNKRENSLLRNTSYKVWLGETTAHAIANSFNLKSK
ncbi:peptidoglycan-binding protein [Virgibacillus sp. CBA3643]|uniref:N-acetylmuramoyl-L-alanine amidase n=1 Tax=Virgibacillus sp. CBA3643 TaxID=2942278 RepID=UPI0035A32D15